MKRTLNYTARTKRLERMRRELDQVRVPALCQTARDRAELIRAMRLISAVQKSDLQMFRDHGPSFAKSAKSADSAKPADSARVTRLAQGNLIGQIRQYLNWSREKFALHLGVDKAAIEAAELGTLRLSPDVLFKIRGLAPVAMIDDLPILLTPQFVADHDNSDFWIRSRPFIRREAQA